MRLYPKGFEEFYQAAKAAGFTHPEGRALYACNRMQNGWPLDSDEKAGTVCIMRSPLEFFKRMKESTAVRWESHWRNGGHISSLRMVAEHNRLRRIRDQRYRAELRRWGVK